MTRSTSVLILILAAVLGSATARARPKPAVGTGPTACNLKSLPLTPGNTWTYKNGAQTVVVKVLEVGPGKDLGGKPVTTATLEEQYSSGGTGAPRVIKTTITCTPTGGMQVALESFFFSGEPGGPVGSSLTVTDRDKATFLPDEQLIAANGWVENVKADVTRVDGGGAGAVHAPAKVEVERHVTVKGDDALMIGIGPYKAQKIVFELRGRGIGGEEKVEIPIKRPGIFWMVKGIGPVKIDDAFDKSWELVDSNLIAK